MGNKRVKPQTMNLEESVAASIEYLKKAEALLITSGAGMGVDSGLPDFRGERGLWNAYPVYEKIQIDLFEIARPEHFHKDPQFSWGFYGHRYNLYRVTEPHEGYRLLLKWINRLGWDYFSVTSNVDGHFQKTGFPNERIYEIHGSINHIQCLIPCRDKIWELNQEIEVDEETMRSVNVPVCPECGGTARPSIPLYGDYNWIGTRLAGQRSNFSDFLTRNREKQVAVVEIGAGTYMPSIRHTSEDIGSICPNSKVIRVNPLDPEIDPPHISVVGRGLEALRLIDDGLF